MKSHEPPTADAPTLGDGQIWYGGDYNPDQWEPGVWQEDLGLLSKLGVNTVTLPVFAWARLQPGPGRFDFEWLDRVIELLDTHEIGLVLATPTAAQPAWLSAAYPEILPVDSHGRQRRHGARNNYCPTSTAYNDHALAIADAMASRYGHHPRLRLWHINNEYGPVCYCDRCTEGFRAWLAARYESPEALNRAWGTATWGHTIYDWSEIDLPSSLNVVDPAVPGHVTPSASPSQSLDHFRFASWTLLQCFLAEKQALKETGAAVPITTNFHGPEQLIDWHEWAPHLDVISWNSYPPHEAHPSRPGLGHNLARGAGREGRFLLMECAPGPTNWHPVAALKPPGRVRTESYQALARGSRSVLFFQVRQSRAGREINHSALIPRAGRLDTRMGAELAALGDELKRLKLPVTAAPTAARIGIIFDWDSWRALQVTSGLDQRVHYLQVVADYHRVLFDRNVAVDLIGASHDFSRYEVIVAPMLYVVPRTTARALYDYVRAGGVLLSTVLSGLADENGCIYPGGSPEEWREVFGMWVEETDARPEDQPNEITFDNRSAGGPLPYRDDTATYAAHSLFDIIRPTTARARASYRTDFYAGTPAITENQFGKGHAFYVGTISENGIGPVLDEILALRGVEPPIRSERPLEIVEWSTTTSTLLFLINHGPREASAQLPSGFFRDVITDRRMEGDIVIGGGDVLVLEPAGGGMA